MSQALVASTVFISYGPVRVEWGPPKEGGIGDVPTGLFSRVWQRSGKF